MSYKSRFALSVLSLVLISYVQSTQSVWAADLNGYTAQYECRSGGPNCNVDVVTLTAAACQQTITTATAPTGDWSALNQANTVICIENGDQTGRGTLTLTTSGTSGTRKILRYTRTSDNDDEPWNQSGANQATIAGINFNAKDFWIVHRLRSTSSITVDQSASDNIFSRILVEDINGDEIEIFGDRNTLQNSVIRNTVYGGASDKHCVAAGSGGDDVHIVNNEIYNCQGDGVQVLESGFNSPGFVEENNDIYTTTDRYADSDGTLNPAGDHACTENGIDQKQGGVSTNPFRIIHNRLWGFRASPGACTGSGSFGEGLIFHAHPPGITINTYGLVQNNIFMDGTQAISVPNAEPDHWSIVGNLIYKMRGVPTGTTRSTEISKSSRVEFYLNTSIDVNTSNSIGWIEADNDNHDIRCNVNISAGTSSVSTGTTQIDYNVYYGSTDAGETNKISNAINTRANSTAYSLNAIIRTTATPPADGTAGDFLYKVTTAGTSASSPPAYCTKLNCVTNDGTMAVKAIRGPYKFYKKLRTVAAGEVTYIPYARAVNLSILPELGLCLDTFASRTGIGINNDDNIGSDDRL